MIIVNYFQLSYDPFTYPFLYLTRKRHQPSQPEQKSEGQSSSKVTSLTKNQGQSSSKVTSFTNIPQQNCQQLLKNLIENKVNEKLPKLVKTKKSSEVIEAIENDKPQTSEASKKAPKKKINAIILNSCSTKSKLLANQDSTTIPWLQHKFKNWNFNFISYKHNGNSVDSFGFTKRLKKYGENSDIFVLDFAGMKLLDHPRTPWATDRFYQLVSSIPDVLIDMDKVITQSCPKAKKYLIFTREMDSLAKIVIEIAMIYNPATNYEVCYVTHNEYVKDKNPIQKPWQQYPPNFYSYTLRRVFNSYQSFKRAQPVKNAALCLSSDSESDSESIEMHVHNESVTPGKNTAKYD